MKKIFILLTSIMLLSGCAETVVLLGPASSIIGGGNVVQSSLSSAANYGIKKTTGKSTMQHALAFAEEQNPNKKKDRCVSFIKRTESEVCYIAKKQISFAKESVAKKIKTVSTFQNKTEKNSSLQIASKNEPQVKEVKSTLQVKSKKDDKLTSVESVILETALNKKQISHLRVSIEKNSGIKDLRK